MSNIHANSINRISETQTSEGGFYDLALKEYDKMLGLTLTSISKDSCHISKESPCINRIKEYISQLTKRQELPSWKVTQASSNYWAKPPQKTGQACQNIENIFFAFSFIDWGLKDTLNEEINLFLDFSDKALIEEHLRLITEESMNIDKLRNYINKVFSEIDQIQMVFFHCDENNIQVNTVILTDDRTIRRKIYEYEKQIHAAFPELAIEFNIIMGKMELPHEYASEVTVCFSR
jgi:hypothetical protein